MTKNINSETNKGRIFVFISYGIPDVNDIYFQFASKCGYSVLTCEESVYQVCKENDVDAILLPERPRQFKKLIKNVDISLLILAGDSYYGIHNYLARHYRSAFIQGICFNPPQFWEKMSLWKQHPLYLRIYKILGLSATLFDRDMVLYEESIRGVLRAVMEKIRWGLKPRYLHGGFCDLVFLQGIWEKEVFTKSGISEDNIRITGSIQADWIIDNILSSSPGPQKNYESSDILFFSQPLYMYSGEPRYLEEIGLLVSECKKFGLKLVIKLHPRDEFKKFERFISEKCHVVRHDKGWGDADNVALIKRSKVVMGKGSSSLLVPLLLQKPTIYLDLFDSDIVHLKRFLDLKLLLKKIGGLEEMYSFAINPDNQLLIKQHQSQIVSILGSYDGKCWQRIKNEIDRFLEHS